MGITTTDDFGRFRTNQGDDEHIADRLDRAGEGAEPPEGFGVPGGMTDEMREAEAKRTDEANRPVGAPLIDPPLYFQYKDPNDDAPDNMEQYGPMNPPRHDRHAAENSDTPAPERVVPSTPTNANPVFADYYVPQQDRPGYADGTDKEEIAEQLGVEPRDPEITYAKPDGPVAGEGAFQVRPTTEKATGVSSPTGEPHNDPSGDRGADTYEEAKELSAAHGGPVKDYGNAVPIPVPGETTGDPEIDKELGLTQSVPSAAGEDTADGVAPEEVDDGEGSPPAKSALKEEWVDYVTANFEVTREEAEAMTKAELVETYGQ